MQSLLPPSFEFVSYVSGRPAERAVRARSLGSEAHVIVKFYRYSGLPDYEAVETLQARMGCLADPLPLPRGHGVTRDGWPWSSARWIEGQSLATWLRENRPSNDVCRTFVQQMLQWLTILEGEDEGVALVHGDLKPSNILVTPGPDGNPRFIPVDFDTLRFASPGLRDASAPGFTTRYAAPEVVSGANVDASADYWSLGIMVLEWLSGQHPFEGWEDAAIRQRLGTTWAPTRNLLRFLDDSEEDVWIALLFGLLERDPNTRWGGADLRRWLSDDAEILVTGLARAGVTRAETAFVLGSQVCHTAEELARAFLYQWSSQELVEPRMGEPLLDWLVEQLQARHLARLVQSLRDDASLSDDERMLRFCGAILGSRMPALWRGFALDKRTIETLAAQAVDGNQDAAGWIDSLGNHPALIYLIERHPRSTRTLRQIIQARQEHEEAWDAVVSAGAPVQMRPDGALAFRRLCLIIASDRGRRELIEYAERLSGLPVVVLSEPWIACLGTDFQAMSLARLLVIRSLLPLETLTSLLSGNLEPHQTPPLIWQPSQQRLMRHCAVMPGARVISLQQGESFSADRVDSMINLWLAALLSIERSWSWIGYRARTGMLRLIRRRFPRWNLRDPSPPARAELNLRMMRVVARDFRDTPELSIIGEAYLAIIRWSAPGQTHVRLALDGVKGLYQPNLLKTPVLPSVGSMAVLLQQPCRVSLLQGRWSVLVRRIAQPIALAINPPWLRITAPTHVLKVDSSMVVPDRETAHVLLDIRREERISLRRIELIGAREKLSRVSEFIQPEFNPYHSRRSVLGRIADEIFQRMGAKLS